MVSTLDMEKLRKVRALMDGAKTDGERQAAKGKAEALAARAGLSLKDALSKLDTPAPQQANPFAGFADWMEEKEPGYKAREAVRRAEKEAARLARCRELLAEYGSEDAVFAETDQEAALRVALAPLAASWHGMEAYQDWVSGNPTPAMWEALQAAYPLPDTLRGIWAEHAAWEKLTSDRIAFSPDYDAPAHVRARQAALERHMDRTAAPTVEGMRARLEWLAHLNDRGFSRDIHDDEALIATLRADFETIAAGIKPPVGNEPQRPAERRAAVLSLLAASPGLSDREIARRVRCSPQTVGNLRRSIKAKAAQTTP